MHPAYLDEGALLAQCTLGKGRSGGPGGQHRNKVETKVMILHEPSGVTAQASERRSAIENRRVAIFRLRLALATQVRTAVPLGECRSELWKSRCGGDGRIACNAEHWDFPALLAEALNVLESSGLDPRKAAVRLECSMSQLVKLVKEHAPAFEAWNRARTDRGLHPIH